MEYILVKYLHILSATVLFGTGLGTAFQMWVAHRGDNVQAIAQVASNVVLADYLFTTPAVIIQPATGIALVWMAGLDPVAPWLVATYLLYAVAGLCWLPVVWLQIRIRDLARAAAQTNNGLPEAYYRYMRLWFILGWPAFAAVAAIFWLMVSKPVLW